MAERIPTYTREHGPLQVPLRVINLGGEITMLKREKAWEQGKRVANTLAKEGDLSLVLTLMRPSTVLDEHKTAGATTIQCLSGRLKLRALGREIELIAGEMIVLDRDVVHTVEAVTESAFLLTIAA